VHCQSDRERELISRPELRQTDRRADSAKADDTEMAVTGHFRPVGLRWPVTAVSVASAFASLLFFVHLRSQQKRTEKVISSYLFEVFRTLVRSVEWSCVSGVDYPCSVPGPPQQSAVCIVRAWTSTTGCSFNGPRCLQSLLKVLNTTLAPFLVWKFLN